MSPTSSDRRAIERSPREARGTIKDYFELQYVSDALVVSYPDP
jgi:hypothetical protein